MFCTKCGKENEDGAKFCNGCGATFESPVTPVAPVTPVVAPAPAPTEATAPAPQQPKKKTGLIIGIVVAVVAVIVAVVLAIVLLGGKDNNKKDDKEEETTKIETTVAPTETTTEAPKLYGVWEGTMDDDESGIKISMIFELTIEDDGSYELVCTDCIVDKDSFVANIVEGIGAELTEAEIQEFLDAYGYETLEDYASDYYDETVAEIEAEYEGQVIETGDDFETDNEYRLDGDTLTVIDEEGTEWKFSRK